METQLKETPKLDIVEEYENNVATDVEVERQEDETSLDSEKKEPWDPNRIRVDAKMFSLRQVLDMIKDGDLELAPDFQRLEVCKPRQKCQLIESILLRIPLPAFYFSTLEDGKMQVVDGVQRLAAVRDFASDKYALQGLEYLGDELQGKTYSDLERTTWLRRFGQTQLIVHVIDPQTPETVKFNIFKRINTGGQPLNAQEIRHCMSGKKSRELLKELTALPSFNDATNYKIANHIHMVDREVALRFVAFRTIGYDNYHNYDRMDDFLTKATTKIDKEFSLEDIRNCVGNFDRAMQNAHLLFAEYAFRKWLIDPNPPNKLNPFNKALFEVWSVTLSKYNWQTLAPYRDEIVQSARQMMTDDTKFIESISVGTAAVATVNKRFSEVRNLVENIVK